MVNSQKKNWLADSVGTASDDKGCYHEKKNSARSSHTLGMIGCFESYSV